VHSCPLQPALRTLLNTTLTALGVHLARLTHCEARHDVNRSRPTKSLTPIACVPLPHSLTCLAWQVPNLVRPCTCLRQSPAASWPEAPSALLRLCARDRAGRVALEQLGALQPLRLREGAGQPDHHDPHGAPACGLCGPSRLAHGSRSPDLGPCCLGAKCGAPLTTRERRNCEGH